MLRRWLLLIGWAKRRDEAAVLRRRRIFEEDVAAGAREVEKRIRERWARAEIELRRKRMRRPA
jgi:hypothetical protein